MAIPRVTCKLFRAMRISNIVESYGLVNAVLAVFILGVVSFDTFIAWKENLFLATSEDDQWIILTYFFGLIGYFMACAVIGDFLYDRPHTRLVFGVLDNLIINYIHIFMLICYLFYWILMPSDVWNPCQYYMPDFYWISFKLSPAIIFYHFLLTATCAFVIHRKRWNMNTGKYSI